MAELKLRAAPGAIGGNTLATAGTADTILLRELPLAGCVNLRLDPRDHAALAAASSAFGMAALPPAPNTWVAAPGLEILWQAYDEWLLVTTDAKRSALETALRNALHGSHHALTDVSDQRAAFELSGPHTWDVLQKGCAVDLHPRVFTELACVQTALARVRVTLRRMNEPATCQVLVERSYAQYLWDWLNDAALEYGVTSGPVTSDEDS